jgi:Tol biopolymer transport system component
MRILVFIVTLLWLPWTTYAQRLGEPGLYWYTLQTEHFRITFPVGLDGLAQEAAVEAESAYRWFLQKLGYAPQGQTDIVLCDATDIAQQELEIFENKIIIYIAHGELAENFNPKFSSWVRQSVFSQYARLVSADFVFGLSEALRPLVGKAILPNWKSPALLRGLAEYLTEQALDVPPDAQTAMHLRTLLVAKKPVSPERAGAWFIRYLAERFGEDVLTRWHQVRANDIGATLSLGFLGDAERLFRRLTGQSLSQITVDFSEWLDAQFSEQIKKINAEGVTMSTPFFRLRGRHAEPQFSPDGRSTLYTTGVGGLRIIQGTQDRLLLPGAVNATWSPDGQKILYIKRDWQKHSYLYGDLYLYDLATKREMRLTEHKRVYRAAFSPDGQKILIAHYRWGDQGPVLAMLDLKTHRLITLKKFALNDYFTHSFAISPDGEQIALSIWRRGGYQDMYLLALTPNPSPVETEEGWLQTGVRALTRDRAVDLNPAFSPDGEYLLFSSDRNGVYNLYAYRMSDGSFFRVTNVLTGAFAPHVSPDRREIAFVSYSTEGYEMHTMPFAPTDWKPVQIEPEPFPPWDGFPDTGYPITPYDPRPSLSPQLWVPLPGWHSLSLLTFGSDALAQHLYRVLLGFDWQTLQPSYRVNYQNRVLLASLETLLERAGNRAHQSVMATLPLITSVGTQQSLSVFYRRDEEGLISHQIGLEWAGWWDLFRPRWEFSLSAVTQTRTGQRVWENHLGWRVGATVPVGDVRGRVFAQWKPGAQHVVLGAELEFTPSVTLRLGLVWDAEQQSMKLYLY